MSQTAAISEYIVARYPELLPAEYSGKIKEMIRKMHEINFFSLSFKGNPKLASSFADAALTRLEDKVIGREYREALENKLQM